MAASEVIAISFSILYFIFFIFIFIGFKRSTRSKILIKNQPKPVSLIIPVKDEVENLPSLFQSLLNQKKCEAEVIFVNDHSADETLKMIGDFIHPHFKVKCISLEKNVFGKKASIEKGVTEASSPVIVTTDADCIHHTDWLYTHSVSDLNQTGILAGSVDIIPSRTFSGFIFEAENLGIQLIGTSLAFYHQPIVISGANLSYPVSVFKKLNPYQYNREILSGDDIFLMQKAIKNKIHISIDPQEKLRVFTKHKGLIGFFTQRIRWMKKKSSLSDLATVGVGLILFLSSFLFLFFAGYQLLSSQIMPILIISMAIKTIVDFLLLFLIVHQRGRKIILIAFFPAFVLNLLSTSILPLVGWWIPVKWKGRKI